ncbi:MAG TPA: hypothetical protein VGL94_23040 [Ktedonobacteraceae bacterium]
MLQRRMPHPKIAFLGNNSDYVDFFETTMDDAREQVENATLFLNAVEAYLKGIWNTLEST